MQGDVPIAYVKRASSINLNPTTGVSFCAGGDLIIREVVRQRGRVQRHPGLHPGKGRCLRPRGLLRRQEDRLRDELPGRQSRRRTGRWNIWEYDMSTGGTARGSPSA